MKMCEFANLCTCKNDDCVRERESVNVKGDGMVMFVSVRARVPVFFSL